MAKLLRFDGTEDVVAPADLRSGFSLEELYTLIGCQTVEAIYLEDGNIMLIDEEGKLRGDFLSRKNPAASVLLADAGGMPDDFIAGDAVICSPEEFQ